ncbi:uncharacterized protein N7469_007437 [Penicillium citrinum]|uniref:ASST-domain-containing protein n=1 Tax=Penicillium citrinum TaxID=5077 RepID=A0A9W9NWE6_PENCI|nr:uncharacterized protein N7469_007437 [Penicillium citrinum]KAJ5227431.1 hypothetical protein N7469_007437 [Penicillium citrinum]
MWHAPLAAGGLLLLSCLGSATEAYWPYTSFKTGPWEPPQLQINKTDGIDPGLFFIPIRNENPLGSAVTIYDNDETVRSGCYHILVREVEIVGGYGYGKVHILDTTYREIYTITLTDNSDFKFVTATGKSHDSYIDVHEHQITDRNTILVSAINVTQQDLSSFDGPSDAWITASQFYEIDIATNEIVFAWNSLDHQDKIPLSESRQPMLAHSVQDNPWDLYHLNSIAATNNGYLISMRFYCSVFFLNKDGSVRWRLAGDSGEGDITGEEMRFSWQHDARVYNETNKSLVLSLFNNANRKSQSEGESTGMVFNIDLTTMNGSLLSNISDPTNSTYSQTQGNFQFTDPLSTTSNIIIGYGNVPQFKEYNSKGEVVFSGQFGAPTHAMSYRVFKHNWKATPFWNPAAVIEDGVIYMSWNGATEYDNWAIYSLPSIDSNETTLLATRTCTGFETNMNISDTSGDQIRFIKVAARRGETILRFSDAIEVF